MSSASRRIRLLPLVVLFALSAAGREALARDTDKSWELGAYVMSSRFSGASTIDSSFGFGVRGGYHLKAIHELEGSLDRVTADSTKVPGVEFDVTKVGADYLLNFLVKGHEKMAPFALFGVGLTHVDNGTDSTLSSTYRVGGGFKYFFTPKVGFRFDGRIFRWHGDGDVVKRDPFYSFDATLAVTFLLGGTK